MVAPALEAIGWTVSDVEVDTDVLGTFAGDVPRLGSALDTARKKALLGRRYSDDPWLLASEGSINQWLPGIHRDVEIVVALHRSHEVMVVGMADSFDIFCTRFVVDHNTSEEEIHLMCAGADLSRHHLVISASDHSFSPIGGLSSTEVVLDAIKERRARTRRLVIQTDLRAHLCPSLQATIVAASRDLALRLNHPCPRCYQPGYGEEQAITGLACRDCRMPTQEIAARQYLCPWCHHRETQDVTGSLADPSNCSLCNP